MNCENCGLESVSDTANFTHIADKSGYRFNERLTDGLIKTSDLQIILLTCRGHEANVIETFCPIEIRFLMPIFQKYLELAKEQQQDRIDKMRIFLKAYKP